MTPIEEVVPVSDPVAEAVGRLTGAVATTNKKVSAVMKADLETLLTAWREAGDRIAELEKLHGLVVEKHLRRLAKAEAQLVSARRVMEPFAEALIYFKDSRPDLTSAMYAAKEWLASQPVPDPKAGSTIAEFVETAVDLAENYEPTGIVVPVPDPTEVKK